jgi:hypothetical protein
MLVEAVFHLHRADVLTAGDDDVLLPVRDHQVVAGLYMALIAGMEPAVSQRLRRLLRLLPVPGEHVIGPGEHLALRIGPDLHADSRDARA